MSGLKKSIKSKNRKIAEFMGLTPIIIGGKIYYTDNIPKSTAISAEDLDYHNNWNSLKPVYDKVDKITKNLDENMVGNEIKNQCAHKLCNGYSIDELWVNLLEFIDWFNEYMKEYET